MRAAPDAELRYRPPTVRSGYFLRQFLSPVANRRQDRWCGSLGNRTQLFLDIAHGISEVIAPGLSRADLVGSVAQIARDLMRITRDLTDMAGCAGDIDVPDIQRPLDQTVFGYLKGKSGSTPR